MKVEIDRAARYYGSMRSKYWTRRTPERGDGVSLVLAMYRIGSLLFATAVGVQMTI